MSSKIKRILKPISICTIIKFVHKMFQRFMCNVKHLLARYIGLPIERCVEEGKRDGGRRPMRSKVIDFDFTEILSLTVKK